MKKINLGRTIQTVVNIGVLAGMIFLAQEALAQDYSNSIEGQYRVAANVTYLTDGDWEGKLDVYGRTDVDEPLPTLVWVHGGPLTGGA